MPVMPVMPRPGASVRLIVLPSKIAPPSTGSSLHSAGPSKSMRVIALRAHARCAAAVTLTFASSMHPIMHSTP